MTSASRSVAQVSPAAPSRSCSAAMRGDLCVFHAEDSQAHAGPAQGEEHGEHAAPAAEAKGEAKAEAHGGEKH